MAVLALVLVSFASLALLLIRQRERQLCYSPMNPYLLVFAGIYLAAIALSVTPRGSLQPGILFICFTLFCPGGGERGWPPAGRRWSSPECWWLSAGAVSWWA